MGKAHKDHIAQAEHPESDGRYIFEKSFHVLIGLDKPKLVKK
jgi:hypothetical protein